MKKYFITGYSGFVAQHFMDYLELLQERVTVLGVDMNEVEEKKNYHFVQCSFLKLNLLDAEGVNKILFEFQPDYLLHLASYSSVAYSWKNPVSAFVNNTNIFLNLVEQIRLLKLPCKVLSVGSSEEYGNVSESQLPVREETVTKATSPYAVARISQEMLSTIYAKDYNVDIVLTRSFNHIGAGQKDTFVVPSFAKKLVDIKKGLTCTDSIKVGNISLIRDFVDVRDVVRAYYLLLQHGKSGEAYNICTGVGTSLKQILMQMMQYLELSLTITADSNLIRPDDIKIVIGSNKKIFEEVGWQPEIPLEKSLADIIDYWMQKT